MRAVLGLVVVAVLAVGCATDTRYSTQGIHQRYRSNLADVKPGMPLADFERVMPDAYVAGATTVDGQTVSAYEVVNLEWNRWSGQSKEQKLWFYFCDDRLIRWGQPGDWPAPADLVVEHR